MKKKIGSILLVVLVILGMSGCASWERFKTSWKSEFNNGLNRVVRVYSATGELLAEHKGKIDIEATGEYVKFDFNGKRYIYYNCLVETIAEI